MSISQGTLVHNRNNLNHNLPDVFHLPTLAIYSPPITLIFIFFLQYPTSISSLSFSNDGTVLAIASSYMHEQENPPDNMPEDAIYIRHVSDQETKPK